MNLAAKPIMQAPNWKIASLLLIVGIVVGFCGGYQAVSISRSDPKLKANLYFAGEWAHGKDVIATALWSQHNLITNIGQNHTRDMMSTNGTAVNVGWISLGNITSIAATMTQLDIEYVRYAADITTPSVYGSYSNFNITKKYTFTASTTINGAGAHWAYTGDNNLYALSYLQSGTYLLWNIGDNITITWVFQYS